MLVSTTIIESGLDIPQANTLIVERADRLGLAQLYQIRGRVGRSRERAYAYLLYPSAEALTRRGGGAAGDAVRLHRARLRASRSRCATSRSAARATCSASEQSGHVAAVGFELYMQMLDEAVDSRQRRAARRPRTTAWEPVRLDVPVDAYVPADYIPYEVAKIDVHRRIAAAREPADLGAIAEELEDRFGPLPEPVENLRAGSRRRASSSAAPGARTVEFRGERLVDRARSSSTPARRGRCARRSTRCVYESLKRTLRVRLPEDEPRSGSRPCVRAADAL